MLYIVASPIGNLNDISLRALEVLRTVDIIAAEDTRQSRKLLTYFEIKKPLISCHGYNEEKSADKIIEELKADKTIAYVSDAGTPGISDPGAALVGRVREAGFQVVPIPGPSALTALLSVSGYRGKTITFEGLLSPKRGRRRSRLKELLARNEGFVLYESPYRSLKLLADLDELEPMRTVLIGREISKVFEEFLQGTASELSDVLSKRNSIKGEFSVLVFTRKIR
mgnify:CR=1 FL=1